MNTQTSLTVALATLLALAGGTARGAAYHVSVDTSALNGDLGTLLFQYTAGGTDAGPGTAAISDFASDTTLIPASQQGVSVSGMEAGTLPGTVTLGNDPTQYNAYYQGLTYGTSLSFDLTLTGTAPGAQSGSTFALSLLDANSNPLLTTTPDGSGAVTEITLNPDGTSTVQEGVPPSAMVTPAAVPEQSTALLLIPTLFSLPFLAFRRRV